MQNFRSLLFERESMQLLRLEYKFEVIKYEILNCLEDLLHRRLEKVKVRNQRPRGINV